MRLLILQVVIVHGFALFCHVALAEVSAGDNKNKKPPASSGSKKGSSSTKEVSTSTKDVAPPTPTSTESTKPAKQGSSDADAVAAQKVAQSEVESMGTYTVRLTDLEDRVQRLKEQIFRSKARLSLLAETVLNRKIAGSKAAISFRNEMGGSFRLMKATFLMDGAPIFNKSDDAGSLAEQEVVTLFDGPVMPGEHTLSVVLLYRGHGFGIFSYLSGYQFTTKSSRTFTVNEGKEIKLEVVGFEKGDATTPLEDRPDVRYIVNIVDDEAKSSQKAGKSKKKR
jgi:hypothetical protein